MSRNLETKLKISGDSTSAQAALRSTEEGLGRVEKQAKKTGLSQITMTTMAGLTSGKNYDVVAYDDSGTAKLDLLPAWTSNTARANAIERKNGYWVNSAAATTVLNGFSLAQYKGLVLGTLRTTGTTTTEDSQAKRFVDVIYNQVPRLGLHAEATASWTYTTSAWRQQNNSSANRIEWVDSLPGKVSQLKNSAITATSSGSDTVRYVGIGIDSTAGDPISASMFSANNVSVYGVAQADVPVGVGYHYAAAMEWSGAAGTTTWYAGNASKVFISRVAAG